MPLPPDEVLVHDRLGEEPEPGHDLNSMPRDRGILVAVVARGVTRRGLVAGDHRVRHDRRARRRAAHDRAFPVPTLHHAKHRRAGQCRRDSHLVAAAEPDARRRIQPARGRFGGGGAAVDVVDERPGSQAVELGHQVAARVLRLGAGVWHHGDPGTPAPGQLDEPPHHRLGSLSSADDHQRAARKIG